MPNAINPRPFTALEADLVRMGFSQVSIRVFRDMLTRIDKILTDKGEVQSAANVTGRTEALSATLQNVDSAGKFNSLGNVTNTNTDFLTDGTGSPITGGKRGFVALDTNNRLANSFRATAVNVSNTPTSSTTLSNDGVSHTISISAYTSQYPPGAVSYNSGSVDPGAFQKSYIYFDDPTFAGGAVTYAFTASSETQTAAEGRNPAGSITTTGGVAKTGGGKTGGTSGSAGGRGYVQ